MRVSSDFRAKALEAVNKANDPALPYDARVAWARIAKVWQDVAQQCGPSGDGRAPTRLGLVGAEATRAFHCH